MRMIGRTISHYRVIEKLGGGGMGEVYRAEDLKLGRQVAVKFLPADLGRDQAALERFEREARLAASLNHPNICTIHEVEEADGQPFIVMELLEGRTLDQAIGGQPLPLDSLLDSAIQVADALDCAHQKGVVHRDIKPSNIFITMRGQPKVLDFGLAKAAAEAQQAASDATAAALTAPGAVAGTVAYMSPEQARGEPLDARTDLFSFGAVLYEMATGIQPFKGSTSAVIFTQILTAEPPSPAALNALVPLRLADVIGKALEKDRALRYQSAADMRADLQRIKRDISAGRPAPPAAPAPVPPRSGAKRKWSVAAVAAAVVFAVIVTVVWRARSRRLAAPRELKLTRLTANPQEVLVLTAALSPDGKYLFFSDSSGAYLQLVESGERHALPVQGVVWNASWFPDSTRLVVQNDSDSLLLASILGGTPRELRKGSTPAVSPDGARIAFRSGESRELWVIGAGGEDARRLRSVTAPDYLSRPVWAPDSSRIAFGFYQRSRQDRLDVSIQSLEVATGTGAVLIGSAELTPEFSDLLWLPDGRIVVATPDADSNQQDWNLWEYGAGGGAERTAAASRKLTSWNGFFVADLSRTTDGRRLAFIKTRYQADVYVASAEAGGTKLSTPRRLTLDERNDRATCWTPDSRVIIFTSDRRGNLDIYKQDVEKNSAELLVATSTDDYGPRLSPDGKWILYLNARRVAAARSDPPAVMRVPVGGGAPELIFAARTPAANIRCSLPPGNLCVVLEREGERTTVTQFDAVQGRGRELFAVDFRIAAVDVCPSGECLLMRLPGQPQNRIGIFALDGGKQREFTAPVAGQISSLDVSPDGRSVYIGSWTPDTGAVLYHADLQGRLRVLWQNKVSLNTYGIPSPDGRRLALLGTTAERNVWLLEDF